MTLSLKGLDPVTVEKVRQELKEITAKGDDVGEVSDDMKTLVHSISGESDFSTSGYLVRARAYLNTKN